MIRSTRSFVWQDGDSWKVSVARPDNGHLILDLPDCESEKQARLEAVQLLLIPAEQVIVLREALTLPEWSASAWKFHCEQLGSKSMLPDGRASE